ncbi:rhomboid family intramembrane serine protease GlpG [Thorsellia kenyensis]|uniref:Rhomboid family intramembrane serine protease GlpG n=1 Tax=Thorsellia kenyensis TaxID=1549888 RepID=A0ABV6CAU6_9GAMM
MKSSRQFCQSSNKQFLLVFADFILKEFNVRLILDSIEENTIQTELFALRLANKDIYLEPEIRLAFEQYTQNPNHPQYIQASWNVGKSDTQLASISFQSGLLAQIKKNALPVTSSLICLSLVVYVLMIFYSLPIRQALFYPSSSEQYSQIWRFISHAFLHFSLLHLLVNSMWIWYLGLQVEKQLGASKLLLLFLFSAFLSGYGQNLSNGHIFGGLSGVVYALTGFCWLYGLLLPKKELYLPNAILIFSIVWIVIGYGNVLPMNIGNEAHLIGLVVGLGFALIDYLFYKNRSRS